MRFDAVSFPTALHICRQKAFADKGPEKTISPSSPAQKADMRIFAHHSILRQMSTGQTAILATFSATLPKRILETLVRPTEPQTTRL